MKKLILVGTVALTCFAGNIIDSDLDGVPDSVDLCPNTPFLETVNKYGCSKAQLNIKKKIKYSFNTGIEYDHYKDYDSAKTVFASLSLKQSNIKTSVFYSVKNDGYSDGYKSNDLILSAYYYKNAQKNIKIKIGGKIYLPTTYNSDTDFALVAKGTYFLKKYSISLSEKHKIYGENGTNSKDTVTLSLGTYIKNLYVSPYAYIENSAYDADSWNKYAGITLYYPVSKNLNIMLDNSCDLEESANYTIIGSIGYTF